MGSSELSSVQFTSAAQLLSIRVSMMKLLLVTLMVLVAVAQASASIQRDDSHGFTCYGVGAFPDPACTGFHVCETNGAGFSENFYPWPTGTLYDVIHKKCIAGG